MLMYGYGMVCMVWHVWYGNGKTLFNDAGPDSNLLISTGGGGVKTLTIYKKGKKRNIYIVSISGVTTIII